VARAVEQQVGEQQPHLPAPQPVCELDAADLYGQTSAELNAGALSSADGHGNVSETYRQRATGIVPVVDQGIPTAISAGRNEAELYRSDQVT
jgi:hypothetical protein